VIWRKIIVPFFLIKSGELECGKLLIFNHFYWGKVWAIFKFKIRLSFHKKSTKLIDWLTPFAKELIILTPKGVDFTTDPFYEIWV